MKQYHAIKEQYPDTLLLFQVGDFYELFFDDAQKAAAFLGITLTARGTNNGEPIPLCGVPVHTIDAYCEKLVKGGYRIALCDQLTEAQPGKVVERGVTQVLTPGTLTNSALLDEKKASYLLVITALDGHFGLCAMELLTGQLLCTTIPITDVVTLESELARFSPDEVVIQAGEGTSLELLLKKLSYVVTVYTYDESPVFVPLVNEWLKETAVSAALKQTISLWYQYMHKNSPRALEECTQITMYMPQDFLFLDASTQRNLELIRNSTDGAVTGSLFSVLDDACTAMGSRLIKKWLTRPLVSQSQIEQRLDAVQALLQDVVVREALESLMRAIGDVERVVGRVGLQRAQFHDYQKIQSLLQTLPALEQNSSMLPAPYNMGWVSPELAELLELLQRALNDDTTKPWRIKAGYSTELDRLRLVIERGAQSVIDFERSEQQKTGINSLKIRYNRVHGYGIEVTAANAHLVPSHYVRLQTLVNRERFTTQELRDLEYDLQRAQGSCESIEEELFGALCSRVAQHVSILRKKVQLLAQLDALLGLARVAYARNYVRPKFHETRDIIIHQGRHPVVESKIKHAFITNDTALTDQESLWIITGPNMGGKSTYMRQVALIAIMAQMGGFVPATSAKLPLIDRIFTRIGAADNVAEGKSTFLVEMEETALICQQATDRSLVILDEVGRGTSTYDGLAIAQAVVEYIYTRVKARCLFATHYHELVSLTQHPGIVAYHASSTQTPHGVVLLHKIKPGEAEGSFGIEVARRAQLPLAVIQRAQELMRHFNAHGSITPAQQAPLAIQKESALEQFIKTIEYDAVSPKQALDILWKLKELT